MNELENVWMVSEREEHERKVERAVRKTKLGERLTSVLNILLIVVIFGAAMVLIDHKAKIYELNSKNLALEKEVADLQSKIAEKNVEISSRFSLESIYEVASKELGMVYPTASRVVSIHSQHYYSLLNPEDNTPLLVFDMKIHKRK
ncbi:MAG: hypothetical protein Q4A41_04045 [Bacillota bacterium]|nr:hypothetical protein [Bacillota bacterium]